MPQSFICMNCHLIFSTKNREPLIVGDFVPQLHEYIGGICRGKGNVLVAAGGMPDHVHLLVSLGRQASVADVVRDIKSNSSAWIHKTCQQFAGLHGRSGTAHSASAIPA